MNKTRVQIAEEQAAERGHQRGMQQGMQQGMRQGELRALRASVSESFEARFGTVPADLAGRLAETEDAVVLRRLLRAVVTAPDAPAARAAFEDRNP